MSLDPIQTSIYMQLCLIEIYRDCKVDIAEIYDQSIQQTLVIEKVQIEAQDKDILPTSMIYKFIDISFC